MISDTLQTIVHSAARFLSGTLLSRVSGFFRDITMAFCFGASPEIALFFVAYRFSYLFRRVLGDGAMQSAFVPLFEEKRRSENSEQFFFHTSRFLKTILLSLIAVSSGILLLLNPFQHELYLLMLLMLPSLAFVCLYGLNSARLQCDGHYFITSFAPVLFNLMWIAGAFLVKDLPQKEALRALSLVMNLSSIGQWLLTVPYLPKKEKIVGKLWNNETKALFKRMSLGIVGVSAMQINSAIDSLFALSADPEGPAYLWYAIRLQQVPLALFGIALSSALLPPLSRAAAAKDEQSFTHFFKFAIKNSLLVMIPITAITLVIAPQLVSLIYGWGEFSPHDAQQTSLCLMAYILGITPATIVLIQAQGFFAKGNYKTPSKGSILACSSNIALNSLMIYGLGWGAASIALATSISSLFNAAYLKLESKRS